MDHHYYWAFESNINAIKNFCDDATYFAGLADQIKYEVWFGEWSLATDNCAQHLNGFNDGTPNPLFKCAQMECPKTYLPDSVAVDFDRSAEMLIPHGMGGPNVNNSIQSGKCFTDSLYFDYEEIKELAQCSRELFETHLNGTFLWTGKNEIEARWDYRRAWDLMWINKTEVPVEQQMTWPDFTPVETAANKIIAKDQTLDFLQ